ncbi:hypothetical protein SDC9_80800 [bioreactor metagenome]|uniref:Uncharacterized protein n=1 Tax=bioreactor metagenome TaxID=1076179 RepID=A0A644Z1P3_9ZZZZ
MAVADGRDTVKGAFQAGAVIGVKFADARNHVVNISAVHFGLAQDNFVVHKACHGQAAQVQHDFQQAVAVIDTVKLVHNARWQDGQ